MATLPGAARFMTTLQGWTDLVLDRVDSFENALTGAGNPSVDKGSAAVPVFRKVGIRAARTIYRANGIGRKLVDSLPDKATSKGWRVDLPTEGDEAPDLDPLKSEDKRLNVWGQFAQAWKWGRRDGGGYILMVTDIENEDLSKPLPEGATIAALQVFTRDELTALEYEDDLRSENYRCPSMFNLAPAVGGKSGKVDASRVLYFAGALLDPYERYKNQGVDDSIYQAAWDQIRNVTTVGQAGANLAQELRLHVTKVSVPDELDAGADVAYFDQRMKLLARQKASVGLIVIGEDEEYETQDANVSGFKDLVAVSHDELAAVSGLPHTEFFGQSPGGLNTDGGSQRQIVNDLVALTQERFLRPPLEKLYTALLAQPDTPSAVDGWAIVFHPSSDMTATEQGALRKTHAESDAIHIGTGVLTPEHVAESRFGESGYQNDIAPIDIEDLEGPTAEEVARSIAEAAVAQAAPPPVAPQAAPDVEEAPEDGEDA